MKGLKFVLFQLLCDESQFPVTFSQKERGINQSIFAMKGRLSWIRDTYAQDEEDVIIPLCCLETCSAECMWASLKAALPPSLWSLINGEMPSPHVRAVAITPGCDRAASNQMMLAHMEALSNDRVLVLPGFCQQHSTANALQPLVKKLKIINPAYCLARRMRAGSFYKRFVEGVKLALDKHLVWIKKTEQPHWVPLEENKRYAQAIMDLAYTKRDLRRSSDNETSVNKAKCE